MYRKGSPHRLSEATHPRAICNFRGSLRKTTSIRSPPLDRSNFIPYEDACADRLIISPSDEVTLASPRIRPNQSLAKVEAGSFMILDRDACVTLDDGAPALYERFADGSIKKISHFADSGFVPILDRNTAAGFHSFCSDRSSFNHPYSYFVSKAMIVTRSADRIRSIGLKISPLAPDSDVSQDDLHVNSLYTFYLLFNCSSAYFMCDTTLRFEVSSDPNPHRRENLTSRLASQFSNIGSK